jgi:macrodomain Ter protein organizer (MatP/YcbG family)
VKPDLPRQRHIRARDSVWARLKRYAFDRSITLGEALEQILNSLGKK